MSSNQINSTTNRVMLKTDNACLQNFQLMNGLTTIVDSNANISDLLSTTLNSDTQTLLASSKTIMDYAIARGLATMDVSGTIGFNYIQQYANSPSSMASLVIFTVDLSYFYVYDPTATNNYTPIANSVLYGNDGATVSNAAYIAEVNSVISQFQQGISLITDILSTQV